jgi:hypothetical protein
MAHDMVFEDIVDVDVDPYAVLTMTYTVEGFEELKKDIGKNGQLVPVVLRDGSILDGRHRHRACVELGISMRCDEVGAINDEQALDLVISNSINKATGTDAAKVEAYLLSKAKGLKNKEMPEMFKRLNLNYVKKLTFIEKENAEYLQILLKHNKVRLFNMEYGKVEDYGTVNGIWRTLKGNKALEGRVTEVVSEQDDSPDYSVHIEDVMKTPAAEQEYWEMYDLGKSNGVTLHPESMFGKKIIALINSKY